MIEADLVNMGTGTGTGLEFRASFALGQDRRRSRVLIVDSDAAVRHRVARRLEADGHGVVHAADGRSALSAVLAVDAEVIGLVVLALTLTDMGGLDVLRRVRAVSSIPIIIVSSRSGETDRILGLDLGADDYVTEPISPAELASRVNAVLRRSTHQTCEQLAFGPLTIHLAAREVTVSGTVVALSPKEFDVLALMARSPRRVLTRAQILHQVWRSSPEWRYEATVTQHVHRLRTKLEFDPASPRWLKTVARVGYRFEP